MSKNAQREISKTHEPILRRVPRRLRTYGRNILVLSALAGVLYYEGHELIPSYLHRREARQKAAEQYYENLNAAVRDDGFGPKSEVLAPDILSWAVGLREPIADLEVTPNCLLKDVGVTATKDGSDITTYTLRTDHADATFHNVDELRANAKSSGNSLSVVCAYTPK